MFNQDEKETKIQMSEIMRHEQFRLSDEYRCPHCIQINVTENIHPSFRNYDADTFKILADCEHCNEPFQLQGWAKVRKAAIPTHSQCRCGRHFFFNLERDANRVRFSRWLGYPYIRCMHCKRKFILQTPFNPIRYWLATRFQRFLWMYKRQRQALVRFFQV